MLLPDAVRQGGRAGGYFAFTHGPAHLSHLDVDGDGTDDLVVWENGEPHPMVIQDGQLRRRLRRAWMLAGAHDDAAVRARLPVLNAFVAPGPGVPARDVLLSLQMGTDDQIRSVLDPRGVLSCFEMMGDAAPRRQRECTTTPRARWTHAWINEALFTSRAFAEVEDEPSQVRDLAHVELVEREPLCTPHGAGTGVGTACSDATSALLEWLFEGAGADMRLRELRVTGFEHDPRVGHIGRPPSRP
jgi:hypothetical protein